MRTTSKAPQATSIATSSRRAPGRRSALVSEGRVDRSAKIAARKTGSVRRKMLQQEAMIERTRRVCREDERLVAAMMYGSFAQGGGRVFGHRIHPVLQRRRTRKPRPGGVDVQDLTPRPLLR